MLRTVDQDFQRRLITAGVPVGVLLIAWVAAMLVYGSVSAAFDRLSGYAASPVHRSIDLGQIAESQSVQVAIPVRNLLAETLTVIGAETDCGCVVADGLPLEIPAFSVSQFHLIVTPPAGQQGEVLDRSVVLFLNVNARPVRIRIHGVIQRLPG